MLYRVVCSFNDVFGLVVFGLYILAFLLAFVMLFLFPPGALLLVLIGISGFVGVWAVMLLGRALERLLARGPIRSGGCPNCGGGLDLTPCAAFPDHDGVVRYGEPESVYCCGGCLRSFEACGSRYQAEFETVPGGGDTDPRPDVE